MTNPVTPTSLADHARQCATLNEQEDYPALLKAAQIYAEAARLAGDDAQEVGALGNLSNAARHLGQFGLAIDALHREAELRARNGDRVFQAYCLNNIGMLSANTGAHAEALAALYQCQQLCEQYAEIPEDLRGACNVNIGHIFLTMGQNEKALSYLEPGLGFARNCQDAETEIGALGMIGLAQGRLEQFNLASNTLLHAISLAQKYDLTHHLIDLYDNLGQVHLDQGQHEQAESMFQQSLYWAVESADMQGMTGAHLSLGRLFFKCSDPELALSHLTRALDMASNHDLNALKLSILQSLYSNLEVLGRQAEGFAYLKAFHDLERRLFNEESDRKTQSLTGRFEAERARRETEMYRQLNEAAQQARMQAEETVRVRTAELEAVQIEIVTRLGIAAEYRDDKTGQHTRRVGELSAQLAQSMGLPADEVELLRWAARLHDIGKIGVSDDILQKKGRYTPEEFERMKQHTLIGAKVLEGSTSKLLRMAEEIALTHHERWDGTGYPRGLDGQHIPISGRIVAVADVFDALTTQRPYKDAWAVLDALNEMRLQAGRQFDPAIVERLLTLVNNNPFSLTPLYSRTPPSSTPGITASWDTPEALEALPLLEEAWQLRQSDPARGLELARQGLHLARQGVSERLLGMAHRNMGYYAYTQGQYEEALSHLSQGMDIGILCDDQDLQADCANFTAAVYNNLHEFEKATDQLAVCLRIAREKHDQRREADYVHNLGVLSYRNRDLKKAKQFAEESLALYRAVNDAKGIAIALGTLSTLMYDSGEIEAARQTALTAIAQADAVEMPGDKNIAMNTAAKATAKLGDLTSGVALLNEAVQHADINNLQRHAGQNRADLGGLLLQQGKLREALSFYEAALDGAQSQNMPELKMEVYKHLSQLYADEGRHHDALDMYRRHHDVERELHDQTAALKTRALMTQLEVERAKSEAQIYRLRTIELANANEALERVNKEKSGLVHMLEEQSKLLERQLSEDSLTGLFNRRYIEGMLQHEFLQGRTNGQVLCVAMADIDHFKQINDRFSHMIGDQVLRTVAQLFQAAVRPTDGIGRFGGEEFLFVLPHTTLRQGVGVCERIQNMVRNFDWSQIHPKLQVSLSIGVAASGSVPNHEKLISVADEQLYVAKNAGRDRISSDIE